MKRVEYYKISKEEVEAVCYILQSAWTSMPNEMTILRGEQFSEEDKKESAQRMRRIFKSLMGLNALFCPRTLNPKQFRHRDFMSAFNEISPILINHGVDVNKILKDASKEPV